MRQSRYLARRFSYINCKNLNSPIKNISHPEYLSIRLVANLFSG